MARKAGSRNRPFPPIQLAEALKVPQTIQDEASGMTVSRLTMAGLLDSTPSSSTFRHLVASSRFYGLTTGGINADEYGLTSLGEEATGGDEVARDRALKAAVMKVPPYQAFLEKFQSKKVPGAAAFKEFLSKHAGVPSEWVQEGMDNILADAETAGLIRRMKNARWVDLEGAPVVEADEEEAEGEKPDDEESAEEGGEPPEGGEAEDDGEAPERPSLRGKGRKVFIAHGKNRTPLEQLKKALDQFKVEYAVAVEEPHTGRPISGKVAQLMQEECSSGIFIFTADEKFERTKRGGATEEVSRPSENVVYELGAASILYENRIVIFKEKGVTFPSDFSDLGYIEFEKDKLVAEIGQLFQELVSLDVLEVRAKG